MHRVFDHLGSGVGQIARVHFRLGRMKELHNATQLSPHIFLALQAAIQFLAELLLVPVRFLAQSRLLHIVGAV